MHRRRWRRLGWPSVRWRRCWFRRGWRWSRRVRPRSAGFHNGRRRRGIALIIRTAGRRQQARHHNGANSQPKPGGDTGFRIEQLHDRSSFVCTRSARRSPLRRPLSGKSSRTHHPGPWLSSNRDNRPRAGTRRHARAGPGAGLRRLAPAGRSRPAPRPPSGLDSGLRRNDGAARAGTPGPQGRGGLPRARRSRAGGDAGGRRRRDFARRAADGHRRLRPVYPRTSRPPGSRYCARAPVGLASLGLGHGTQGVPLQSA